MEDHLLTEIVGIGAGTCTALSLLPQLIKLFKEKKAEGISVVYLITLFTGLCLWIYYGFKREDLPIILTNVVSLVINILVLILSIRYKNNFNVK